MILLPTVLFVVKAQHVMSSTPDLATLLPLYVGPDQLMPFASALGAILGILLMFWHRAVDLGRRFWGFVTKKSANTPDKPAN